MLLLGQTLAMLHGEPAKQAASFLTLQKFAVTRTLSRCQSFKTREINKSISNRMQQNIPSWHWDTLYLFMTSLCNSASLISVNEHRGYTQNLKCCENNEQILFPGWDWWSIWIPLRKCGIATEYRDGICHSSFARQSWTPKRIWQAETPGMIFRDPHWQQPLLDCPKHWLAAGKPKVWTLGEVHTEKLLQDQKLGHCFSFTEMGHSLTLTESFT